MSKGRLEALTDGIFATVMTVLVLSLSIPVITQVSQISTYISSLAPIIYGYVLSFLILAVFWIRHHNIFHFISRVDGAFLWLNLVFLLTIGFIPFSTELLGRFPLVREAVILYGANLFSTALCLQALWRYALRWKLITHDALDEKVMARINRRMTGGPLLYVIAIAVSFVNPLISVFIYAGILVYYIIVSSVVSPFHRLVSAKSPP
jgi:uncharacterized membrane protein